VLSTHSSRALNLERTSERLDSIQPSPQANHRGVIIRKDLNRELEPGNPSRFYHWAEKAQHSIAIAHADATRSQALHALLPDRGPQREQKLNVRPAWKRLRQFTEDQQ
jgi:hypothetical protein